MLENLIKFIETHKTVNDKNRLAALVKEKFALTENRSVFYNSKFAKTSIFKAPLRAKNFSESAEFKQLKTEPDALVKKFQNEILIASLIENVKIGGILLSI